MAAPSRLSNADAAWLGMDEPENLMTITAVLEFDETVDWDRLRQVVGVRLLERYPKFSQRPVPAGSPFEQPVWEDDPDFDLDDHVEHVTLAASADRGALDGLVGDLLSRPLDMRHSPWRFHLVDRGAAGSAVVARLHHCIADGIALASVLLALTDDAPHRPVDDRAGPADPAGSARRPGLVGRVRSGATEVSEVAGVRLPPARLRAREAWLAARFGLEVLRTTVRILSLSRDPRTRLRGRLGVAKAAAWTRPHDLGDVKAVARRLDATVNDVLLAVAAGAVRRHLLAHGDRPRDLRVFVPVNLRPPVEPVPAALGNRFGLVLVRLPVARATAAERVREVRAQTGALKASSEAAATFVLISVLGALPAWAHGLVVRILGSKCTAIVTNVPGPRQRVYLAGSAVSQVVFWVPQAASVGLGISVFSYAGTVTVGVAADAGLVPDPGGLAAAVEAELAALGVRTTLSASPHRAPRP